jgi:hypothetical protein
MTWISGIHRLVRYTGFRILLEYQAVLNDIWNTITLVGLYQSSQSLPFGIVWYQRNKNYTFKLAKNRPIKSLKNGFNLCTITTTSFAIFFKAYIHSWAQHPIAVYYELPNMWTNHILATSPCVQAHQSRSMSTNSSHLYSISWALMQLNMRRKISEFKWSLEEACIAVGKGSREWSDSAWRGESY